MKLLLGLLLVIFVGCSVTVEKIDTKRFSNKISYFKDDRTGLCFAAVAMKKGAMPVFNNQNGVSFTCVPCEKVENYIK
jgi:hypothetical protein